MATVEELVKTVVADLSELHDSELLRDREDLPVVTDAYERFFLKNHTWISLAEKTLSSALFFVPDRYGRFELPTEILYAFLNQLATVHDTIWHKFADIVKLGHSVSFIDKSTLTALRNSPYFPSQNRFLAFCLTTISNVELLLELLARSVEDKASEYTARRNITWTVIAAIEVLKAAIRTRLLMLQGGTMLAFQRIPARPNRSNDDLEEENEKHEEVEEKDLALSLPVAYFDFDLHRLDEEHKDTSQAVDYAGLTVLDLMIRQKKYETTKEYLTVMEPTPPSMTRVFAEVLWIYRPLIYLLMLYRCGTTSWKPWFTSLVLDLASRRLNMPVKGRLRKSEENEMTRRSLLWFYYLLRSPFFETFIARGRNVGNESESHMFANVPLIGNVLGSLVEFMRVYKTRYFYTAGSD